MSPAYRNPKLFWQLLKVAVAALSLWFIWIKVSGRAGTESFLEVMASVTSRSESITLMLLVFVMMLLNWGLESLKWQHLLKPFCMVSFALSFRAVLSGTTISLFTPNRIGEFAGRVLHLEPPCRMKGVIATITGSMSQLLVTILAGCAAILLSPAEPALITLMSSNALILLASLIPFVSLFVFFSLPGIPAILPSGVITRLLDPLKHYNTVELLLAVVISAVRYFVFAAQFYLVLVLFGISIPFQDAMRLIAVIYFVMTIVPTMAVSEIAVRGSVALYFLSPYSYDTVAVLAASTLLWLINLAVPAGLGALSSLMIRINR